MEQSELNVKKKARRAARSWLSRNIKKLEEVLNSEEPSFIIIKASLETLDKSMKNLEVTQREVEMLISDEEMEADIEEASGYMDNYVAAKLKAEEAISVHRNGKETSLINSSMTLEGDSVAVSSNVQLPKLNLPKFGGDPLDFFSFWERFDVAVDSTKIPEVNKFIYLKSTLEGDALAAVRGLSVTPNNYSVAKDIILDRFGRKEKIIFHHVESLLNFQNLRNSKNVQELWAFRDEINGHIRSLKSLGITGEQYGVFLTPIILNKLPAEIRLEWARSIGKESDIQFLMDFLCEEIKRKERSMMFHLPADHHSASLNKHQKGWHNPKTVSTFLTQNKTSCAICDKFHRGKPEECFRLLKASKAERAKLIKAKGLCFICFDQTHHAKDCKLKCKRCYGKHHELICNNNTRTPGPQNASTHLEHSAGSATEHVLNNALVTRRHCNTILQMLKVDMNGSMDGNKNCVNVLLDGGSDHTYVTSEVVRKIRPKKKGEVEMAFASFGCDKPSPMKARNVYSLELQGVNGCKMQLEATEIENICTPIFRPKLPPNALSFIKRFPLREDYKVNDNVDIDILIGMDNLWAILKNEIISVPDTNLVLQQSVFGWVLSGSFKCVLNEGKVCMTSHQLHCCEQYIPHFQNLWDLESIGIREEEKFRVDENQILAKFEETVSYEDGCYKVSLPWKKECNEKLQNNELVAKSRLTSLMNRLKNKPQLLNDYMAVFGEMEREGIIVEVPKEKANSGHPIFYLPHHPVVKETSLTTKVRPVFDASCCGPNGLSLNDCLWSGPCLLPDLVAVLLRFRRWPVAITADVKQAFLNIRVNEEDTDVHRFLLPSDDGEKIMKFVRVPFGNKSSPFLLNATVKHHLGKYEDTRTVTELRENLYVDDWLTGSNTTEECLEMINEATAIMSSASLPLAKWACNNNNVNEHLNKMSETMNCLVIKDNSFKVLGVQWNKETDCLVFDGLIMDAYGCPTKRSVLGLIARVFDPFGLLAPFIMLLKILFQDIWKAGLEWDEQLPESFKERFAEWTIGLEHIRQLQFERSYFPRQWNPDLIKGLYGFCDASEKAYGACVYLTVQNSDGSFSSTLVYSKAKVAPLKSMTLPRLELLGALLLSRMISFVKESLGLLDTVPSICFTDSMVALSWIKGCPTRWQKFVSNRVTEIQKLTHTENWYHVSGKENPADMISRGISGGGLILSDLWLHGPKWIGHEGTEIQFSDKTADKVKELVDVERVTGNQLMAATECVAVFDVTRWSVFDKAVRIVALVLRFIQNVKKSSSVRKVDKMDVSELRVAEVKLICHEQKRCYTQEVDDLHRGKSVSKTSSISNLNPFVDSDGILRARRRLEFAKLEFDEMYPIIIPRCHLSALLIRRYHLTMKHAGVDTMITAIRNKYWIIGLRKQAKKIKSTCIACQIQDSTPCCQTMAPLPPERVRRAPVFSICGIDCAGPLFCVDCPGKKLYVLLFTCAVVRAVHVELVDTLSVNDFLLGFIRFVCRRSLPVCIITDNAKTFISAREKLIKHYGSTCPVWKFNAPLSPWWGAFWERMVRSIKSNLRKSVGNRTLSRCELETTLHEVESCVNSRPLTFVGDTVDSVQPLTPSHFLTPNGTSGVHDPSGEFPRSDRWSLGEEYSARCRVIERFWERWSNDYLQNLPCVKTGKTKCNLNIGSLVLIKENEQLKRLQWPIGMITRLFPGKDGLVRAVEVNTRKGKITRPIQRIHILETAEDCNLPKTSSSQDLNLSEMENEKGAGSNSVNRLPDANVGRGVVSANDNNTRPKKTSMIKTKSGRVVKPKSRLDL